MKKSRLKRNLIILYAVIIAALIAIVINAFIPSKVTNDYPYGTWRSDDPVIEFTVNTEPESMLFAGTYVLEGEEVPIWVSIDYPRYGMDILKGSARTVTGTNRSSDQTYFIGSYSEEEDTLIFKMNSYSRKETGRKEIVFTRVKE